jgi:Protein of unknown function (DUF3047)
MTPIGCRGIAAILALAISPASGKFDPGWKQLDVKSFQPVEGPTSKNDVYYRTEDTPEGVVLRGEYVPGRETVTMGVAVPEPLRERARYLRWRWRALRFPEGGDECRPGRGDSAASVSVVFKGGLRWYILKYVWSTLAPAGAVCDRKRTPFLFRDTVVLARGGEPGTWHQELIDVRRSFIDHFAKGNPRAQVPDLVGLGVLTDGDQTHSESAAEWTGFALSE